MTREEARAELDACTLRPSDASAEARAFAEQDQELSQWLGNRTQFDEAIARALQPPAAPAEATNQLFAAMQAAAATVPRPAPRWRTLPKAAWLAAAAALILAAASVLWQRTDTNGEQWQSEALALVTQVDGGHMPVDHVSNDLALLKTKLAQAGAPVPHSLPTGVTSMRSLACKVVKVAGRPASVVCFLIAPGQEAHLVVLDNHHLPDTPPQHQPQFSQKNGWHIVSWSEGRETYLLVSQADEALLRQLFAAVTRPRRRSLLAEADEAEPPDVA